MAVYLLRLEGNSLRGLWHWVGMNASVMTISGRLLLKAQSEDYFQVPRLYAWTGKGFGDVSRDFPSFYARSAAGDDRSVLHDRDISVGAVVGTCQLALESYELARHPELGRKVCLDARARILSGRGVMEASRRKHYPAMRRIAVAEIDSLLAGHRSP